METIKEKYVNIVGEDTGTTYSGHFKFKCLLSPLDRINVDKQYRSLLGPNILDAGIDASNIANILSELLFRIKQAAPFWNDKDNFIPGDHIPDRNVLLKVYENALAAELEFKQEVKKQSEESKKEIKEKLDEQSEE